MNPKIKQLAEESNAYELDYGYYRECVENPENVVKYHAVDLEKFAKLIIEECSNLCDRFQERDVGMQPAECAGAIRKMFGIEK